MYYIFPSVKFFSWLFKSSVSVLNLLDILPIWEILLSSKQSLNYIPLSFPGWCAQVRSLLLLICSVLLSLANGGSCFQNPISFSLLGLFLIFEVYFNICLRKGIGEIYIFENLHFWEYLHFLFLPSLIGKFRYLNFPRLEIVFLKNLNLF